jgi:hypothetical protein
MISLFSQMDVEQFRLFGIKIINVEDFFELLIRFALNLVVIYVIVQKIYKDRGNKEFSFSFYAVGISIFLLAFLLNSVKLELGFALGLFAIFGIIRYRTDVIPIKEMTYLFVVIAIAVINALSNKKVSYIELLFTNLFFIVALTILEKTYHLKSFASLDVVYDNIEELSAMNDNELKEDLETRTGFNIHKFEVKNINLQQGIAKIKVYYYSFDADA